MAEIKSILKPENSLIAGLAVVALVIANYNLHNGTAASAAATGSWDPHLKTSNQKAGWTSLVLVSGLALVAKDANIFILGCATIIAEHSSFIHSIAVEPQLGAMAMPSPNGAAAMAAYAPTVSGT
jgi:hypothetical protein